MKLQVVVIDEPVHIQDPIACELWRKALWAKEAGYRKEYKTSILPMSTDDFFGTHLIVAEETKKGSWEPVVMYKVVRRSQAERFGTVFGAKALVNGTQVEHSEQLKEVLNDPSEISYDSSWSINPEYKKDKEFSKHLRDYATMFGCNIHLSMGYSRWLTAGVVRFKIDQYFEWMGGQEIIPEFKLSIIDEESVRMFYVPDARNVPQGPKEVAERLSFEWKNRIVFEPQKLPSTAKKIA